MALGWIPQAGDLVQIDARNRWELPAGRYRLLKRSNRNGPEGWTLEGITTDARQELSGAMLVACETGGSIRPIPRETETREAQEVRLRLHAPLMGLRSGKHKPQHDASDLALFRASDEPPLF